MRVIFAADVVPWDKVGEPTEAAGSHGISLSQRILCDPATYDTDVFSSFVLSKNGNQVFPVTHDGCAVLVRQYWHGVDKVLWTIPGGVSDGDETPEQVARRELREETGYSAQNVVLAGSFALHARKSPSWCNVLIATDCRLEGKQMLDKGEIIEVAEFNPDEFWGMVFQKQIIEPYTVLGAYLASHHGYWPFPS